MYVCMYVCMYVVCMYVCMNVCWCMDNDQHHILMFGAGCHPSSVLLLQYSWQPWWIYAWAAQAGRQREGPGVGSEYSADGDGWCINQPTSTTGSLTNNKVLLLQNKLHQRCELSAATHLLGDLHEVCHGWRAQLGDKANNSGLVLLQVVRLERVRAYKLTYKGIRMQTSENKSHSGNEESSKETAVDE
jgi:hypothetical protein